MKHYQINMLLNILANIILHDESYYFFYQHFKKVLARGSSQYVQISKGGIHDLMLVLEETGYTLPNGKDKNSEHKFLAIDMLIKLTTDFSVQSGLSSEEWKDLAKYLYISFNRVHHDIDDGIINPKVADLIVDDLLNYPWAIILLLMEIGHIQIISLQRDLKLKYPQMLDQPG